MTINKNDLRYTKTHNNIKHTYHLMLIEIPKQSITVRELSSRAQINRKTFYLHFDSLEDLYNEVFEDLVSSYATIFEASESVNDIITHFFAFYTDRDKPWREKLICSADRKDLVKLLLHINNNNFQRRIMDTSNTDQKKYEPVPETQESPKHRILNAYMINAMTELYLLWVSEKKQPPYDEMIQFSQQLITKGIDSLSNFH